MLRARLFGGLGVEIDGRPMPAVASVKARSLLAFLLLRPGPHDRAGLAARFWPDVLDTSARASLRGALWELRGALGALGAADYLAADRRTAGIAPDRPRWIDAEEVERLLADGGPDAVEAASELAAAPLLPELADEWALAARDGFRERLVAAAERLGDEAEGTGDLEGAVAWARRAIALDRLDEVAYRALIRRLAVLGRSSEALAAYRRCAAALSAELGAPPSPQTRALAAELRALGGTEALGSAPGPAPPRMVGRDGELRALRRAWDGARAGRGGVAVVAGGAGIGKSRLALELRALARADGARCATGTGLELEGGAPLAPWVEGISELAAVMPVPPADAGWPSDVARLTPAVEQRWSRAPAAAAPSPDLERARLLEAVVQLAAWAAAEAPLLLVLEDLHLADPASLALLGYLGRRLAGLPAMVLATRRDAVVSPHVEATLDLLRRQGALLHEQVLRPLGVAATADVVRDAAPGITPQVVARVAALAEGNPLLARGAARAAARGEDPAEGIRATVRAPLARLPVAARLLVDLASVAARPLTYAEAAELVGAETLPEAIAAGVELDLLDPGADRRVRFQHALVREACEAEIAPARRSWLHARLAGTLAGRGAPSAEVARHLLLSGDEAAARDRLVAAAAEARALGALDTAAEHLREAVSLAGEDPQLVADLLLRLADVEAWRGRRTEWDGAVGRAIDLLGGSGDALALAAAHVSRGMWLRTSLCYPGEALEAYRVALGLLEDAPDAPELRALALAGSAWAEAMAGDPSLVARLAEQVDAIPEAADDEVLTADLALARAGAMIRGGDLDAAEAAYEAAAALAERAGRPDLALVAWANAASAAACRGDFSQALDLAGRGRGGGPVGPALESLVQAARVHALSRMGRHEEARAAAREAEELALRLGGEDAAAQAAFDGGVVALAAGRPGEAARRLAAALEHEGRSFPRPLARILLAEALVERDPDAADAELERVAFEPVGAGDLPATLVARMARAEGLVAAVRGDLELADRRLADAEAGWRRHLADAPGEAFAASLVDLGRPPVAGLVEPGVELGRTLVDRARVLTALGRPEDARAAADEAQRLADELAFDGYRGRLAALGAAATGGR